MVSTIKEKNVDIKAKQDLSTKPSNTVKPQAEDISRARTEKKEQKIDSQRPIAEQQLKAI